MRRVRRPFETLIGDARQCSVVDAIDAAVAASSRSPSRRGGSAAARLPGRACRGTASTPSSAARLRCFSAVRDVIMMIGMCASLRIALDRLREFEAVHPRHLDVEQDRVRRVLGQQLAARRRRPCAVTTSKPSRVSSRLVILRTVSESSTTITSGAPTRPPRRCAARPRPLRRLDRVVAHRRRPRCASCTGLMISTISPVPSTVAPEMPGHARQLRPDVLHDDFLVADHLVDVDRRRALAAAQQQHRVVARRSPGLCALSPSSRGR